MISSVTTQLHNCFNLLSSRGKEFPGCPWHAFSNICKIQRLFTVGKFFIISHDFFQVSWEPILHVTTLEAILNEA
jgi:hypothetical protein